MPSFNARVTCYAVCKTKEGVDPVQFILQDNDYLAEPKNNNGCIIVLKPEVAVIIPKKTKKDLILNSDKPDRYMHFSFRGSQICVDTVEKTVISSKKAKAEEMIGPKENKMWPLNVETSN